jgi:hypothetical protein
MQQACASLAREVGTSHGQFAFVTNIHIPVQGVHDAFCQTGNRQTARSITRLPIGQFSATMVDVSVMPYP